MQRLVPALCCLAVVVSLAALMSSVTAAPRGVSAEDAEAAAVRAAEQAVAPLQRQLDDLHRRLRERRTEGGGARADAAREPESGTSDTETGAEDAAATAGTGASPEERARLRAELSALLPAVLDGSASPEDLARFLAIAREGVSLDDEIAALEARVAKAPRDVAARMELADWYLTKLMTVPGGPEQGVWGGKAEREWMSVLDVDAEHWQARYNVATNWAMWPEFLGKTDDAVRQFETLVEVQERGAREDRQAGVYVQLARLYRRQGRGERARDLLARGLERHPEDRDLKDANNRASETSIEER